VQTGDKVYFTILKDHLQNCTGIVLKDLDDMVLVENKGCQMYLKKDRITQDLKDLFEITVN